MEDEYNEKKLLPTEAQAAAKGLIEMMVARGLGAEEIVQFIQDWTEAGLLGSTEIPYCVDRVERYLRNNSL